MLSWSNMALGAASLVLALVLAELVLRWVLPPPILFQYPQTAFVEDAELFHHLAPDQSTFTHDEPVRTNSLGFRSREHPRQKPRDVARILALGDSQTFGNGLTLAETWPKQLETVLNQAGTGTWSVINGGVPATSTWHHEIHMRRLLEAYEVDAVILAFYVNDVDRRTSRGPFEVEEGNELGKRAKLALKGIALVNVAQIALQALRVGLFPKRSDLYEVDLITGAHDEKAERNWGEVGRVLDRMSQLAGEHDVPLLMLVLPRRDQVDGRQPGTAFNQRARELAEPLGIAVVDALPALRESYDEHGQALFIAWDGHNSALSNLLIARELARVVPDLLSDDAPPGSP